MFGKEVSIGLDWFEVYSEGVELSEYVKAKHGRNVFAETKSALGESYYTLDRNLYDPNSFLPRSFGYSKATGRLKIGISSSSCTDLPLNEGFNSSNFEEYIERLNYKNEHIVLNSSRLKAFKLKAVEIKIDVPVEKLGVECELLHRVLAHGSLMQFKTPSLRKNGVQYSNESHSRVPYNKKKQIEQNKKLKRAYEERGVEVPNIHREDIRIKKADKCISAFGKDDAYLRSALNIPKMIDVALPYFKNAKIKANILGKVSPNFEDKVVKFSNLVESLGSFSNAISHRGYISILNDHGCIDIARESFERLAEILKSKNIGDKAHYRWITKLINASTQEALLNDDEDYVGIFKNYHEFIIQNLNVIRSKYINQDIVSNFATFNQYQSNPMNFNAIDCTPNLNANGSLLSGIKSEPTPKGLCYE